MHCPRCRTENLADAAFCEECAAPLERGCPACGAANRPGAKFCRKCGAALAATPAGREPYTPRHLADKILTSRSALEGERKQVTVLFADVQGSMEMAESLDPEEWHRILDRFLGILADGVHRFEGTVNQFTGDGVMALFGAPIAHEDHAQRACHAALHLVEALRPYADALRLDHGLNFSARIGINSGEVVVGRIGDDLRMDYTAQGHTVGLAARMEQIAAPGTAYLTEHTARLVEGFFRLRDLGLSRVKGVHEPLHVYQLEGTGALRTRFDASRARGLSRFVGRHGELAVLDAALDGAMAGGGRIVGIVAEAGTGKSRLCHEFVERCRANGVAVRLGHGVSHGGLVPFLPVLELLRDFFGIADDDPPRVARERIAGRLLLIDESFRDELPLIFEFLGVADPARPAPRIDPEARQRRILDTARRVVERRAMAETTVTLLEDVHWFDPGSLAFLEVYAAATPGGRHLLILNYRPEFRPPWAGAPYFEELALRPLGPEAVDELLRDLLGADPSLAALPARIRERTGGNPFFVEEVVQALAEAGTLVGTRGAYRLPEPVEDLGIPASVQALLAARIDRRSAREKTVLQTAAVIGRTFGEPVLRRVVDLPEQELGATLRALAEGELVQLEVAEPERRYAFKHPLTHEVAYRSQLKEARTATHAAVARAIATIYPAALDERAALLAHHWESAGATLEAASWHRRAAEWAGLGDVAISLRHWRRVRDLVAASPDGAERVALGLAASAQLLNLGWRVGASAEEAAAIFAEGKALAARVPDRRPLLLLVAAYGAVRGLAGDTASWVRNAEEALELAVPLGDAALVQDVHGLLSAAYDANGQTSQALAAAERAVAMGTAPRESFFGVQSYGFALGKRGDVLSNVGRIEEGRRDLDGAIAIAHETNDRELAGFAHAWHAYASVSAGDHDRGITNASAAMEIAERIGGSFFRITACNALAAVHSMRGESEQARAAYQRALNLIRDRRANLQVEPHTVAQYAELLAEMGDHTQARTLAEEALALARHNRPRFRAGIVPLAVARVFIATDGVAARDRIAALLDEAWRINEEAQTESFSPFVLVERAALARLEGDEARRRTFLEEAVRRFVANGAAGWAAQVAREG